MLSFNNNNAYDHIGRERQVIELYNQGKSTRDIAKELRMSLRDISIILKKHGVNHGLAMIGDVDDNNKKSHSNNEKAYPGLQTLFRRKEACGCGYPTKSVRKGSNEILHRILETKAPIQFISYLPGIKGKSFLYPEVMRVSKKTRNNS